MCTLLGVDFLFNLSKQLEKESKCIVMLKNACNSVTITTS